LPGVAIHSELHHKHHIHLSTLHQNRKNQMKRYVRNETVIIFHPIFKRYQSHSPVGVWINEQFF
jgi:hypothetical protein